MARLNLLLAGFWCVAVPVCVEVVLSVRAGAWVEIPAGLTSFLTLSFAAAAAAKVYQSTYGER